MNTETSNIEHRTPNIEDDQIVFESDAHDHLCSLCSCAAMEGLLMCSQFHRCQVFDVGGLAFAIERDDQRQADGHFRRGDGDDEKDHYLSVQASVEPREG